LENNISDLQDELGQIAGTMGDIFDDFQNEVGDVIDSLKRNCTN